MKLDDKRGIYNRFDGTTETPNLALKGKLYVVYCDNLETNHHLISAVHRVRSH